MDFLAHIAERKIAEAVRRGDLDDLALKGKPIVREDLSGVPEELRMGYKILKNANILPEELQLNRQLVTLRDLIACCDDPGEKQKLRKRLTWTQLQLSLLLERHARQPAWRRYGGAFRRRFGL